MIVDDSEQFLAVARDHLTRGGLDIVATATNQQDALEQAEEARPDVVLVDINLGAESGVDLSRRLVERFPDLRSRIVLISTLDEEDIVELIAEAPAVGFLPKTRLSARAVRDLVDGNHRDRFPRG
jgi:DNA-binding NarL/FixJ family response regulator